MRVATAMTGRRQGGRRDGILIGLDGRGRRCRSRQWDRSLSFMAVARTSADALIQRMSEVLTRLEAVFWVFRHCRRYHRIECSQFGALGGELWRRHIQMATDHGGGVGMGEGWRAS